MTTVKQSEENQKLLDQINRYKILCKRVDNHVSYVAKLMKIEKELQYDLRFGALLCQVREDLAAAARQLVGDFQD